MEISKYEGDVGKEGRACGLNFGYRQEGGVILGFQLLMEIGIWGVGILVVLVLGKLGLQMVGRYLDKNVFRWVWSL